MALKGKSDRGHKVVEVPEPVSAHEKIARLLGVLVTKDIEQIPKRVPLLRAVGFTVPEVASILGMTENHVSVASYNSRKKPKNNKAAQLKKH